MNTPTQIVFEIARATSAIAFLSYGIVCLIGPRMEAEFKRYGLARFRRLIGALECLGALGLVVGHFNRPVLVLSAAGLTLTMLMAIATRIRIGDSLAKTLPAIVLLVLNAFVLGFAVVNS
ncbi:MAG: DoxX family protein [bacterium]